MRILGQNLSWFFVAAALFAWVAGGHTVFTSDGTIGAAVFGNLSEGAGGYTASHLTYHLDPAIPERLAGISFDLRSSAGRAASVPTTVRVSLDGGVNWLRADACSHDDGGEYRWICTTAGSQTTTVASVTDVEVTAVE